MTTYIEVSILVNMHKNTSGFTIVELLVTIVVIAILATISVVAYTGIQDRASDAVISSDLAQISRQMRQFQATEGRLPVAEFASGLGELTEIGINPSKDAYGHHYVSGTEYNLLICSDNSLSPARFVIVAASRSGTVFISNGSTVSEDDRPLGSRSAVCPRYGISNFTNSTWLYRSGWLL